MKKIAWITWGLPQPQKVEVVGPLRPGHTIVKFKGVSPSVPDDPLHETEADAWSRLIRDAEANLELAGRRVQWLRRERENCLTNTPTAETMDP